MITFRYLTAISDIDSQQWNAISGHDYPFTRHAFLAALELSGSVSQTQGWQPHNLTAYDGQRLIAVMPLYIKSHSYGEYIFDWAWADAYHRHGLEYYPKLLAAIPFTPATGPRLCIADEVDSLAIRNAVSNELISHCQDIEASSVHLLFPEQDQLLNIPFMPRSSVQFHWFNQGFKSFDDFLATFKSRKRKNLNKERLQVANQGVTLKRLTGCDIDQHSWQQFYHFYQLTYAKRSGHGGYLTEDFFNRIAQTMKDNIMLVLAIKDERIIAGALNFFDSNTLYGRYWGCIEEIEYLHFEACYYQGIEFCIEKNIPLFNPGTQGEHKILRGFEPFLCYSNHKMKEDGFDRAIADFLQRETPQIIDYAEKSASLLPYKDINPEK